MLDQHLYSDTYGPNIWTWLFSSKGIISVKECSEGVEWLQCRHDSTELLFPLKCAWASLHMPLFLGFPVYCMGTIVVLFGLSVFSFSLRPPEFSAFCLETCGTQAGYSRRSFSPLNLSPQTHKPQSGDSLWVLSHTPLLAVCTSHLHRLEKWFGTGFLLLWYGTVPLCSLCISAVCMIAEHLFEIQSPVIKCM